MSNRLTALFSLVVGVWLSACAATPEPINRVQTNLVEKGIFQGEWWYTSTSIDVDFDEAFVFNTANAGAPFSGSMSTDYALDYNRGGPSVLGQPAYSFPIARIRWVIDENYLFAYRAFELVSGGNPDGRDDNFRGEPLAVFKIEDHVDVRKDFSSTTGEETNVTVENKTDRKWFDRKLMRVDWSQNLLTKFSANDVQSNELFTAFRRESVPFFVQDGSHKDMPKSYQPQFVRVGDDKDYTRRGEWSDDKKDTVHYMSFVTQEVWSPADGCLRTGGVCASATATMRNSFLRIPDKHSYAAHTETNAEFDHFGIFRSHQPTYAAGGNDRAVQRKHCASDADCSDGGACDTASRRATECTKAGKPADCRKEENICVGGLTSDLGQTDFLSFYSSRLNFFQNSLSDKICEESWECDGRYTECASGDEACQIAQTSVCDPAAHRCTVPVSKRKLSPVRLHLSPHFPPYLVRQAFEAVADWNEVLMRGHRAAKGILPFDQSTGSGGVTTVDWNRAGRMPCQRENPVGTCFCGSPQDQGGSCRVEYDPFESPDGAIGRGILNPYDCYVQGPADKEYPKDYAEYFGDETYTYKFTGDECMLTLSINSCDADPSKPCEELGDLRYNFVTHLQQGGANFGGVAQPLSDPTNGELITVSATMAAESLENVGSMASQFFPVLNGQVSEDSFFAGENVRGYFAAMDKVERPVTSVPTTSEGNEIADTSRPSSASDADSARSMSQLSAMKARIDKAMQKAKRLQGSDGRASILSDRMLKLKGSPIVSQLADALSSELPTNQTNAAANAINTVSQSNAKPSVLDLDTAQKELERERQRKAALAARNMDDFNEKLFNSQYFRYYAEKFKDRPAAEASLRMQQAQFKAVTLHELGHVLGLRHNFAGSLDRNNYPDAYFRLAVNHPLPTFEEYDSPTLGGNGDQNVAGEEAQRFAKDMREARETRLLQGAGSVMTASIMDYNGDMSDFAGLGRYDKAAVLYSYFDKVEASVGADPTASPDVPADGNPPVSLIGLQRPDIHRRELWTYYRGGESCQVNQDCPFSNGRESTIYQPLAQRCVANPRLTPNGRADCKKPGACVCSNFYDDFDNYANGGTSSAPQYAPVKYLFCHDNRTSDLSWCTRSDAGESYSEVVEHYRRAWRERYPQVYFRQYSAAGPQKGAGYSSVVEAVKIYQHMFFRLNYEGGDYRSTIAPLGFSDQLKASASAFDWLTEIIGAPDVGSYKLDEAEMVYRQVSHQPDAADADIQLPIGQGLYLWSEYQTGLNGFFRLERAGTFLDKILAIQALTKRDWGFQYQVDEFFYVNFYDFFEKEIVDLFAGLISRNPRQYAPRLNADNEVEYISAFRNFGTRTTNQDKTYPAPAIDGSDSETLRDFATISALSEFPVFYDTSFEQRLLVFKLGSGDGYKIPEKRRDGTPTCQYVETGGCEKPDYIIYESDRLHTSYVAVMIDPGETNVDDEQQVAFQLLKRLAKRQNHIRDLTDTQNRTAAQNEDLERSQAGLQRDESFLEYLIELERQLGISSYFF